MNKKTLDQIFQKYIDRFDFFNDETHCEYYKWQICHDFPVLMDKALSAPESEFVSALKEAKKCTENIIDSYTTPFGGLVDFASHDPEAVRKMFLDLYSDDGGDLDARKDKINDFFGRGEELLEKYNPGSYLYKQNSHSVSSYLFLYDPDNHYMYKATQCNAFAESIEFYTDWGSGDNIKLDAFYRMCDEILDEIKKSPELLDVDQRRFDGRLKMSPGELHKDINKHILLFDIIYCTSTYDLLNGIRYKKRNSKEKSIYLAEKHKAEELLEGYSKIKSEFDKLDEALEFIVDHCKSGDEINHKKYGKGIIKRVNKRYIVAGFSSKEAELSLTQTLANGIIKLDIAGFSEYLDKYRDVLKSYEKIHNMQEYYSKELEKYSEYID